MYRLIWVVLTVFVLCADVGTTAAQQKSYAPVLANGSDAHALVSIEVTAVEKQAAGRTHKATLKIVHVYSGSKDLKGKDVFADTGNQGRTSGYLIGPLLQVGETGVAVLFYKEFVRNWVVRGLLRKDRVTDYERVLAWAEKVEQLVNLDVTKRLMAARGLCEDKNPRIAQLGVEVLFAAKHEDAKRAGMADFFTELPDVKGVTTAALVVADDLLIGRDKKKWVDSDRRKALVARFTGTLSDDDAVNVAAHVVRSRYFDSPDGTWFTAEEAASLLTKIATDSRQSKNVRQIVVARVVESAGGAGAKADFTFDILAAVVRGGIDNAVRLEAAKGLARFKWGDPAQVRTLRASLVGEKDAEVAKALESAIDKSK